MTSLAVETFEDRVAARTRLRVVRGKHEAVNDQRVLPRRKELGEPHLAHRGFPGSIGRGLVEHVVLRNAPSARQLATQSRDLLDAPPELDLAPEQRVAGLAVWRAFAGKTSIVNHRALLP